MKEMNICSNENLSFEYSNDWKLESEPDDSNPDCIATLTYNDESILNVIAFPSEMPSLSQFREIIHDILLEDNAEIISSEIANVNLKESIQIHSKISIPEISFDMYSVIFLEDGFIYIFELRTLNDVVSEFMEIIDSFRIL